MSYAIVGHCGALAVQFRSEIVICCVRISFFWLRNQDSTSSLVSNSKDKARFVCLGVKSKWFSAQNSFRIAELVYY